MWLPIRQLHQSSKRLLHQMETEKRRWLRGSDDVLRIGGASRNRTSIRIPSAPCAAGSFETAFRGSTAEWPSEKSGSHAAQTRDRFREASRISETAFRSRPRN